MVWLTWLGLPLLAVVVALRVNVIGGLVVLAVGIIGQILYIRWFPHMSKWMGYGSVADTPAATSTPNALPDVTLYTANVCPFCPIVKQRLEDLQRDRKFEIRQVDVTFRPEIIRAKGLRSVPVLEVNGQFLVGNATSVQIVNFLQSAATAARSA